MGDSAKKIFVLDTNVLLFDPLSIFKFKKNIVIIPFVCVEELDRFKKDQNENGRNARNFSRIVDDLRKQGSLSKGVPLESGGILIIEVDQNIKSPIKALDLSINDNMILATALHHKQKDKHVVLVSKDINLRLKADVLGLIAEDFGKRDATIDELYTGNKLFSVSIDRLKKFEQERFLQVEDNELEELYANEYMIVCEINNESHRLLGRYSEEKRGIVPLIKPREGVWGIYPKNVEQQFAFDALLNNEVKLVSLVGKAGTGKTLLAIAAGLDLTITQEKYSRLLVSRPVQPMGKDLGYLPGDVNEKLAPWMQPVFDNLDFLFGKQLGEGATTWDELITQGLLYVEPLTYIRGRTIPGQYLIVDEAQNLSPHEVKTIITRAGEGTKIILTGDCEQIDSPYLDSVNNGLAYCVERLKQERIVAHITLTVGERSELSEIASKNL
ncbi:MAG: phosphate starvation-inducible protein PhoH [Bdellovibrionales bacterium RIFOXYD12_FULL_39_22]|nr:MAG: phosphate starvation-inducible protein PhoH [Bdellovibrionales bacterium RIFOXYB1_FULL_39_21]OFZ41527.1 MAG: phosphate starvation-inducible protein PhoH [Bdellovibrionales bacterium RIFOXYC12_FULL_39_17]OFZ45840.1 MAG: phosphate starvation-inducible protein PhoH [Bdellovibrionales bacterium RIFOXYC1_FULL_39_130]OFZ74771.1 MAG: phosphate starvation-inducible protein PhoH [Bdellovibrionales bacterium RIFOXYD1_FULL_39_84]OFZ92632.1 MAG: phosphate starvation-inducible protein PhoH [Bdellovi